MLLAQLVAVAGAVASTRSRTEKVKALSELLHRAAPDRLPEIVAMLSGSLPTGRIGVGPAAIRAAQPSRSANEPTLTVDAVLEEFQRIAETSGKGATQRRSDSLRALLERAQTEEQVFLRKLLLQELRQGALEGLMVEAIALAFGQPPAAVRRAAMLAGDLPAVAVAAHAGAARLAEFRLEHFRPVQPMLASPVDDLEEIWGRRKGSGSIQLEHKLDGARVQVHRRGNEVRVYTRQLHEVTSAVPEIVKEIRALDAQSVVLDGETFACDVQGRSLPFQVTMRRFGRRSDTEQMRQRQPLRTLYFDCLERDGFELLGRPLHERWSHLGELFDPTSLVPRLAVLPNELARAREFLTQALEQGREGLMAKEVESTYEAGRRGASWLKIKPVHTLDLVVLAAEWGSGRRRGWLSNLHLGARDPTSGAFVMLGKTFKGLTDQTLRWQTKRLQELRLEPPPQAEQHEWVVQVRPELVVEIACNNIQASPQYPAGMALRFARVKRYRPDKTAEEANTVHDVRAIFQSEQGPVADPAEQSSAKEPDLPPEKSTLS